MDEMSIRQLEFLFWSVTRDKKLYNDVVNGNIYSKMFTKALLNAIYRRCVSLKARGLKYVVNGLKSGFSELESLQELNLDFTTEELYVRLERIILIKLKDFTNHDLLNILESFLNSKFGSDKFYERIFHQLISERNSLRPREFVKLFNILPHVHHIYENSMNEDLWNDYLTSVSQPIFSKSLSVPDLLSVFKTYISLNYAKGHSTLFYNMINQIRGAVYQVPAEQFSETMVYLIEAHINDIAEKFIPIIESVCEKGLLMNTFKTDSDRVRLLWALSVLNKVNEVISPKEMEEMINSINLLNLDAFHYRIFIQLLNMSISIEEYDNIIDYDKFYDQLSGASEEFKQEILNNDLASKTKDEIRVKVREEVDHILHKVIQKSKCIF